MTRSQLIVTTVAIQVAGLVRQPAGSCADTSATVEFSRDVLPILIRNCFRCHEGRDSKSGVRLDQRPVLLGSNGDSALVVPGNSRRSKLWIAVSGTNEDFTMPPKGPRLKPEEIDILKRWIDTGMSWDERRLPDESGAGHWAFQRIQRPVVPTREDDLSSENPVDRFIADKRRE